MKKRLKKSTIYSKNISIYCLETIKITVHTFEPTTCTHTRTHTHTHTRFYASKHETETLNFQQKGRNETDSRRY